MRSVVLILVTMVLCNLHIPFIPQSDHIVNLVYDVSQYSLHIFLLGFIFRITPKSEYKLRGSSLLLVLMYVNLLMNTIYDKMDLAIFYFQYPIGIILFSYFTASTLFWKINDASPSGCRGRTYIAFKIPRTALDIIITLFRQPVSSVSILSSAHWYKFKKGRKGLQRQQAFPAHGDFKGYFLVCMPDIQKEKLDALVGKDWRLIKCNCVTVFRQLFLAMGIKLGRFDFIPAVFAYKLTRGKYNV